MYGETLTYREYLAIVLPKCTVRAINQIHWCDLFNNGDCNKRFPNVKGFSCDDCYDQQMKPKEKFCD